MLFRFSFIFNFIFKRTIQPFISSTIIIIFNNFRGWTAYNHFPVLFVPKLGSSGSIGFSMMVNNNNKNQKSISNHEWPGKKEKHAQYNYEQCCCWWWWWWKFRNQTKNKRYKLMIHVRSMTKKKIISRMSYHYYYNLFGWHITNHFFLADASISPRVKILDVFFCDYVSVNQEPSQKQNSIIVTLLVGWFVVGQKKKKIDRNELWICSNSIQYFISSKTILGFFSF